MKNNYSKLYDDDLLNNIFKALLDSSLIEKVSKDIPKQENPTIGKLVWKKKTILSHDTRVSPMGQLITEINYRVPVSFDKEDPGPIQISKIVIAFENLLDRRYSNFLSISSCSMVIAKGIHYALISGVFSDHGPSKKEK